MNIFRFGEFGLEHRGFWEQMELIRNLAKGRAKANHVHRSEHHIKTINDILPPPMTDFQEGGRLFLPQSAEQYITSDRGQYPMQLSVPFAEGDRAGSFLPDMSFRTNIINVEGAPFLMKDYHYVVPKKPGHFLEINPDIYDTMTHGGTIGDPKVLGEFEYMNQTPVFWKLMGGGPGGRGWVMPGEDNKYVVESGSLEPYPDKYAAPWLKK